MASRAPAPLALADDLTLLAQVLARQCAEAMMDDLAAAGLGEVREADGFVFQHLQDGPVTVTELGRRLGITQQGASKAVSDLERRGLVARAAGSGGDGRTRAVALTEAGWAAIHQSRRSRRRLNRVLDRALGDRSAASLRADLLAAVDALGGVEVVAARRIRPPR